MLSKLLKNDLKKNMRWFWILFSSTIALAGITRACKALGENIAFFKLCAVFFESIFYALAINSIIQPFLRNFLNFTKSFYSDESYLTHTLPVTKNQLINSKYLTSLIEMLCAFLCLIVSLLIVFASPTMFDTLKFFISTIVTGTFSVGLTLFLFIILILVEFLMFLSIIFFSITMGYKSRDHKVFKSFLITSAMALISIIVLGVAMVIVLAINDVKLSASTLVLSNTAFISVLLTAIVVYSAITLLFYFLTKHEFNKGVNVD